jgi:hypothetical protein
MALPRKELGGNGGSGFIAEIGVFDGHILEFAGLKDVSAFHTLDELTVLFASHNLHAWVLTRCHVAFLLAG